MPKFGMKDMLIAFAAVAIWLSTFTDYPAAGDVRRSIVMLAMAAATLAAYWSEGRRKAFWLGFALIIIPAGWGIYLDSVPIPMPRFYWATRLFDEVRRSGLPPRTNYAMTETIRGVGGLLFATIAGFIGTYIYDHTRKSDDA